MDRLLQFFKRHTKAFLASGLVVVAIPTIESWWEMFYQTPMIPTLLGQVTATGILSNVPWVVLIPPVVGIGVLWFAINSLLRTTLPKPFVVSGLGYDERERE